MICERIKEIREYFDNKQKELADVLKVSRSTYAGWENGIDPIPLVKLYEFCNYYGISMDYVCELTNIKKYDFITNTFSKENLGKKLKEVRTDNNDTQAYVSDILKVDQSNYSKYELGKVLIHTYPLIEFAKHYKVSIDWLVGRSKNKKIK